MLKKKNIYVISISCLIIFLVSLSSFLGLVIYFQWRQLDMAYRYYETMEESDTISYASNIDVNSLKSGLEFRNVLLVEGRIKNKGKRSVVSIALNIKFLDSANNAVYNCLVYPMEPFQPPKIFKKMRFTYFAFLKGYSIEAGRTVLFKCPLWKCPKRFVKMLRNNSFSNKPGEWSGRISATVFRLRLKI